MLVTLALILAVLLQVVAGALPVAPDLGGVPITAVLGLAGVPLVVALVEATKRVVPDVPPRFYPVLALGWAVLLNVGAGVYVGADPVAMSVASLIVALAAVGLYSGGRAVSGPAPPSGS